MEKSGRTLFLESRRAKSGKKNLLQINSVMNARLDALKRLSTYLREEAQSLYNVRMLAESVFKEIEELQDDKKNGLEAGIDFFQEVKRFEISLIQKALAHSNGNQSEAAKILNLKATTLNEKLRRFGLIN